LQATSLAKVQTDLATAEAYIGQQGDAIEVCSISQSPYYALPLTPADNELLLQTALPTKQHSATSLRYGPASAGKFCKAREPTRVAARRWRSRSSRS